MDARLIAELLKFRPRNYGDGAVSVWHKVPMKRRAAVFVLLFLGPVGELRVVLTKRLLQLRSFPGHISLPGGLADLGLETPWQTARRETEEEIGLSADDQHLLAKYGFRLEHTCDMPCYLLRTFLVVKPVVGFLKWDKPPRPAGVGSGAPGAPPPPNAGAQHAPHFDLKVNPGESSSIFSKPLYDFLHPLGPKSDRPIEALERLLYQIKWGGIPWNLRSYTFPQYNEKEVSWLQGFEPLLDLLEQLEQLELEPEPGAEEALKAAETAKATVKKRKSLKSPKSKKPKKDVSEWGRPGSRRDEETKMAIYDVWGLTANILHDLAEVAYLGSAAGQLGEEELIYALWEAGQIREKTRLDFELRMISASPLEPGLFGEVIPRPEFVRLKRLYKM